MKDIFTTELIFLYDLTQAVQIPLRIIDDAVPFRCRYAVAVTQIPYKRRKNYVAYVKNSVAPLPLPPAVAPQPPFRSNRSESYFCRSAVGRQQISVLVTSSLCIRKDISSISVLTRNGNGSYGMEEKQRYNGMSQWHNGTAALNGKTATAERNGMVETRQYTELLIGRVALTSFNWRTYWVVRIGAYSLNSLRLG